MKLPAQAERAKYTPMLVCWLVRVLTSIRRRCLSVCCCQNWQSRGVRMHSHSICKQAAIAQIQKHLQQARCMLVFEYLRIMKPAHKSGKPVGGVAFKGARKPAGGSYKGSKPGAGKPGAGKPGTGKPGGFKRPSKPSTTPADGPRNKKVGDILCGNCADLAVSALNMRLLQDCTLIDACRRNAKSASLRKTRTSP